MNLNIKSIVGKGKTIKLNDIKSTISVKELKEIISKIDGISINQQLLVFNGNKLISYRLLESYNIVDNSTIYLCRQLNLIRIYIASIKNTITLMVPTEELISILKQRIMKHKKIKKININEYRFVFNGVDLNDNGTLSDYGIKNESTIEILLRLNGGARKKRKVDSENTDQINKRMNTRSSQDANSKAANSKASSSIDTDSSKRKSDSEDTDQINKRINTRSKASGSQDTDSKRKVDSEDTNNKRKSDSENTDQINKRINTRGSQDTDSKRKTDSKDTDSKNTVDYRNNFHKFNYDKKINNINISIKTFDNKEILINNFDKSNSNAILKETISKKDSSYKNFVLIFDGKILKDNESLGYVHRENKKEYILQLELEFKIQVFVKIEDGTNYLIDTKTTHTVEQFKKSIENKLNDRGLSNYYFAAMNLIFEEKNLDDDKVLAFYRIKGESTIQLAKRHLKVVIKYKPTSQIIFIDAEPTDSIKDLKKVVKEELKFNIDDQILWYEDHQIVDDDKILKDFEIGYQSTFELFKKHVGKALIFAKKLDGECLSIYFDSLDSTVEDLKVKIQNMDGMPIDQQRIIYDGKQLEDGRKLSDCHIENHSTVHLVTRMRGS